MRFWPSSHTKIHSAKILTRTLLHLSCRGVARARGTRTLRSPQEKQVVE